MSGIYHTEYGSDTVCFSEVGELELGHSPELCYELVGKAHLLCLAEESNVTLCSRKLCFHIGDLLEGLKEEGSDLGDVRDLLDGVVSAEKLCDSEDVVVTEATARSRSSFV